MKSASQIPRGRRAIYLVVLILIPILFFALLEAVLSLLGFHDGEQLIVRKEIGGREVYSVNRNAAARYFGGAGTTVPEPHEDTFEIQKSDTTIRIFCLGESTMAGFPYEFSATAPSFLEDRLTLSLPRNKIEVINIGISAVGSYVVSDLFSELAPYEPDLVVMYVGHNEFYGAYGVGSTIGIGGNPALTRVYLTLLQFKTFLLVRDATFWIAGLLSPEKHARRSTLMADVI